MKLLSARFENFRFLRDLELRFAVEASRRLTVIRAANESGKTTVLHGLQWALYGDEALPARGVDFRLHPIDWDFNKEPKVPISATVEFELTSVRKSGSAFVETRKRYRLIRTTFEGRDGATRRPAAEVKLFLLDDTGAIPINAPQAFIVEELPTELRDVFFTDGDRALSFIEADVKQNTKRDRVQRAIRSLLGLEILEAASKHVGVTSTNVNREARKLDGSQELRKVAEELEAVEEEFRKYEFGLKDANQQFAAFDEKCAETQRKIDAALQKGDKDKLRRDMEAVRSDIAKLDDQLSMATKAHSALFRSQSLADSLLQPVLGQALAQLESMHDQGKIPNTTLPVLRERLEAKVCICGESLLPGNEEADKRCKHIRRLITENEGADETRKLITAIYYEVRHLRTGESTSQWLHEYEDVVRRRDGLRDLQEEKRRRYRSLESELDALPDTDIQGLRDALRDHRDQRDRFLHKASQAETQLQQLKRSKDELTQHRDRLLKEQRKGQRLLAELDVAKDVLSVLERSYAQITNEELEKVSTLTSQLFLEMIGAAPDQRAIIQRAEVSKEFDILVYGPQGRTLNPDRDLNGASRRALTLSFILALTKVSEVEAPNVIDTPLGMTSGYVKRAMLRTAIRESSQLVLFLTHDEISGCEQILDESAGVVVTLTNPAHFPKQLANDPGVVERRALICQCDHRTECALCRRKTDAEVLSSA